MTEVICSASGATSSVCIKGILFNIFVVMVSRIRVHVFFVSSSPDVV